MRVFTNFFGVLLLILVMSSPAFATPTQSSDRASFAIEFEGLRSDLRIITTSVMPGELLLIKTDADARATGGTLTQPDSQWQWKAPEQSGLQKLSFMKGDEEITLNVFVLTPFRNGVEDRLQGYRVGQYSKRLFRGLSTYAAPRGFIKLTDGPANLKVSPHFTLGQFICKQQPGHDPTFLLIRPATLIKLEALLEAANEKGWQADTLYVMSGFRTPFYNAAIGNKTTSSRHLYGGAADVWLDGDGDGQMDDLNGDGVINKNDARTLAKLAETLAARGEADWPGGGIGIYGANAAHGPFIHIDSRGYRARW